MADAARSHSGHAGQHRSSAAASSSASATATAATTTLPLQKHQHRQHVQQHRSSGSSSSVATSDAEADAEDGEEDAPLLDPAQASRRAPSVATARSARSHHEHADDDDDLEAQPIARGGAAIASGNTRIAGADGAVPFPHQPSAAHRFRPKHYRTKRGLGKLQAWSERNTGFLLLALAQVFYATMALFFKILNDLPPLLDQDGIPLKNQAIGALQVIVVRMAVTAAGCYIYLFCIARDPHPFLGPPAVRKLLVIRGFSGFFGLFGLYYSLQFLDLADATVLTFLSPLATAILAAIVLKESLQSRQLAAGLVCILGVTLIARPFFLFGHSGSDGGGGDFDNLPVPGGDEGGGIGDGQQILLNASATGRGSLQVPAVETVLAAADAAPTTAPSTDAMGAITAAVKGGNTGKDAEAVATILPINVATQFVATTTASSFSAALVAADAAPDAVTATVTPTPTPSPAGPGSNRRAVTEEQRVLAVAVALLGVLGSAGAYTSLRCIGTRASPTHSVAYFSTWSLLVAGAGMLVQRTPFVMPRDLRWGFLMVLIGLCGLAAQILAAMGLAREKAGRATVAVYLQAPITVGYQLLLLRTPLEPLSALGSGIILVASIWVTMAKS